MALRRARCSGRRAPGCPAAGARTSCCAPARDGRWAEVDARRRDAARTARRVLAGPLLPGLVDAHSHAFQRAFAGLAERRDVGAATTSGRGATACTRVALRITPAQLRAIAAQLYVELLRGGYTQVCEFHYLQHAT